MGVPTERQMERLTNVALDAMETEVAAWRRIGTWMPQMTRLVRYPSLSITNIGPAEIPQEEDVSIQQIDLPDNQVNDFLRRAAVQAAVKAVLAERTVNVNAGAEL
jgi:hypothetical protein